MTMSESYNVIGNTNTIITIYGQFENVTQSINAASIDPAKKNELLTLKEELEAALARVPAEDAGPVAEQLKLTMDKVAQQAPNKKSLAESLGGIIRTAKDLAEVLPIATKIVSLVAGMFGVPLPS
jgi:hypothetical protein